MFTPSIYSSNSISSYAGSSLVSREVTLIGEDDSTSHTDMFYVERDSLRIILDVIPMASTVVVAVSTVVEPGRDIDNVTLSK